jgi:hypothetical protein
MSAVEAAIGRPLSTDHDAAMRARNARPYINKNHRFAAVVF